MKIHVTSSGDFYYHIKERALESICSISQAKIEDIVTMRKQEQGVKWDTNSKKYEERMAVPAWANLF